MKFKKMLKNCLAKYKGLPACKRRTALSAVLLIFCLFVFLSVVFYQNSRPQVLEFGMFTGSNWDVENADAFVTIDRAIERFTKKHPGVTVHYTSGIDKKDYSEWCAKQLLNGTLPDIMMVSDTDFNQYCSLGVLQNLDRIIEDDASFPKNDLFHPALEIGRDTNQSQYALPYEVVPTMLFVNKTLLEKEGIQMPRQDWTWEEFLDICSRITKDTDGDGRIDQFATYNYTWLNAVNTSGGQIFDDVTRSFDFTNPEVLDSLRLMKELLALNQGEKVTQEDFDAGRVAFMPLTFAEYRTYKTYPYKIKRFTNFQWDCTTFPGRGRGNNVSKVSALLLGINRDSDKKELAWEFMKELVCSSEGQMDLFRYSQGVSVLRSITASPEAATLIQQDMDKGEQVINTNLLCNIIENGTIDPKYMRYETYERIISLANTEITDIFEKNKNIESSMKIFQRELKGTE